MTLMVVLYVVFSANITTSSCMLCSRLTCLYIHNLQRECSAGYVELHVHKTYIRNYSRSWLYINILNFSVPNTHAKSSTSRIQPTWTAAPHCGSSWYKPVPQWISNLANTNTLKPMITAQNHRIYIHQRPLNRFFSAIILPSWHCWSTGKVKVRCKELFVPFKRRTCASQSRCIYYLLTLRRIEIQARSITHTYATVNELSAIVSLACATNLAASLP